MEDKGISVITAFSEPGSDNICLSLNDVDAFFILKVCGALINSLEEDCKMEFKEAVKLIEILIDDLKEQKEVNR